MYNFLLIEQLISKHKAICLQISKHPLSGFFYSIFEARFTLFNFFHYFNFGLTVFGDLFNFTTRWTRNTDHAGFTFDISILGFSFDFSIYDTRHADELSRLEHGVYS